MKPARILLLSLLITTLGSVAQQTAGGLFDFHNDLGPVVHPGSFSFEPQRQEYTMTGAGTNMWFGKDEGHFAWKKLKGDFILRTRIRFVGKGMDPHRKVGLMIRSSMDTGSIQVSGTVHGDGLTALQYRTTAGANMQEFRSSISAPEIIQLERNGNRYTLSVAKSGDLFTETSAEINGPGDEVFAGIFICSHNKDITEEAVFSNTRIVYPSPATLVPYKQYLPSMLEIQDLADDNSTIIYQSPRSIQAPNWTTDAKALIFNGDGILYHFDLSTKVQTQIPTGDVVGNNNDHVISFDGKMLAISSSSKDYPSSRVYTVPINGGKPMLITPTGPSYLHGWSPDGKWLAFVGQRNGDYDIYRVPSAGGKEERLTTAPGLDDGCEYSPDGRFIYFNSVRSGKMQIWRMNADGSEQKQITNDTLNNWFPHVSPDGKRIVFITFGNDVAPGDHPFYKHVYLRTIPVDGSQSPRVVNYLYGGQGTINTPSWAPDSRRFAFISNSGLLYGHVPTEPGKSTQ
jgi:Tol biopolymer transport system component